MAENHQQELAGKDRLETSGLKGSERKPIFNNPQQIKEDVNKQRIQGNLYAKSFTKNLTPVEIVKDIIFNVIATELHHQFSEPVSSPPPLTAHEARAQQLGLLTVGAQQATEEQSDDYLLRRLHTFRHRTLKRLAIEVVAIKDDVLSLQQEQNRKATGNNKKGRSRPAGRKNRLLKPHQMYFNQGTLPQ